MIGSALSVKDAKRLILDHESQVGHRSLSLRRAFNRMLSGGEEYVCESCGRTEEFEDDQDALDNYWSGDFASYGMYCHRCDIDARQESILWDVEDNVVISEWYGYEATDVFGDEPLFHKAAFSPNAMESFLEDENDPNLRSDGGDTVLHKIAKNVQRGNEKKAILVAKMLINAGANVNATNDDGHTPLYYLRQNQHQSRKLYGLLGRREQMQNMLMSFNRANYPIPLSDREGPPANAGRSIAAAPRPLSMTFCKKF